MKGFMAHNYYEIDPNVWRQYQRYVVADWVYQEPKPKKTIMKTVSTMMKKLLDADTQKLVKAGYLNGDLDVTEQGRKELINILLLANKSELVSLAEEKIKEAEKASD